MRDRRITCADFIVSSFAISQSQSLRARHILSAHARETENRKSRFAKMLSRSNLTGLFDNWRTKMKLSNEQCRDQALIQFKLGNYINASRWYNTAAARTVGHKKADAYEAKARECAKLAGASYDRCYFAEDYEAITA
jgi:hypothetical protein